MQNKEMPEYANLDWERKERTGYAEVVFCEGKEDSHLVGIFQRLYEKEGEVLGTRANEAQYQAVKEVLPAVTFDPESRLLKVLPKEPKPLIGRIAVCCAGTSDIGIAEEAAQTADFFGNRVERYVDIGVSGLHRLLSKIDEIRKANVVVAVAGMEGALASVLGGQVSVPVIGVPTSVGYGTSFQGLTPLLAMLNSCANGVSVVNIDNGYGAGYLASQINRLATNGRRDN